MGLRRNPLPWRWAVPSHFLGKGETVVQRCALEQCSWISLLACGHRCGPNERCLAWLVVHVVAVSIAVCNVF